MAHLYSQHWKDYELIDAGGSKKLERWGDIVTIRPERNAYFKAVLTPSEWTQRAHFEFVEDDHTKGEWKTLSPDGTPEWKINYKALNLKLQLTKYKHLGLFPEQQANWDYIEQHITTGQRFLNLFGYTGAASLIARKNGADVFHCDSVKQIIGWGKENMEASGMQDIHWVLEDALKFAQREVRRGNKYDGIIMDPPAFGLGAKKERWNIESRFPDLLEAALQLRSENGFVIANTYSTKLSIQSIVRTGMEKITDETMGVDTLCIKSTTGKVIEYGQRTLITK